MKEGFNAFTHWRYLVIIILIFLLATGVSMAAEKKKAAVNCDIQNGLCRQSMGDRQVTLEIFPKPVKAMEDLTFQVTLDGEAENVQPYLDLNMPAMNMGKNRVSLKKNGPGRYEGKGTIVRCRSGRRIWSAKVTFPGVGDTLFIFDVIY